MPAGPADRRDDLGAQFGGNIGKFAVGHAAQIGGACDTVEGRGG